MQHFLNIRLKEKNVQILTSTKVIRLDDSKIWVENTQGLKPLEGFEAIVMAIGAKPNNELDRHLRGKVPEMYLIGDASQPREVMEALLEAEETGQKI